MSKKVSVKFCPKCRSRNIGWVSGTRGAPIGYVCKDCNYQANIFPEKEAVLEERKR